MSGEDAPRPCLENLIVLEIKTTTTTAVPERKPMSGVDRPTLRMAPAPECTGNGVTVGHKPRGC
jgi:hypothetical protein